MTTVAWTLLLIAFSVIWGAIGYAVGHRDGWDQRHGIQEEIDRPRDTDALMRGLEEEGRRLINEEGDTRG